MVCLQLTDDIDILRVYDTVVGEILQFQGTWEGILSCWQHGCPFSTDRIVDIRDR